MKLRKTVARKPTTAVAAATAGRGWAAGILVALVALSLFSALAPSARAAGTAPQIVSLTYSPASVDVTSGPASVTFTAHLTDGSPITWAPISLVNSAAHQQINAQFQLVSGTAQNGVWQTTAVIPQGAAAGSWDYSGSVQDATTSLTYGSAAWQNQPLPASAPGPLTVTDSSLSAPPQIVSLAYSPSSVDVKSGPAYVTFTAHLTDGSPVTSASMSLVNSAAHQQTTSAQFQLVSGTAEDGVWKATVVIPQGASAGSWDYTGMLDDAITSLGFGSASWQNQPLPASAPGPSRSPRGRSLRRSPARPITATTTPIQW